MNSTTRSSKPSTEPKTPESAALFEDRAWLQHRLPEMLALLERLVNIDSGSYFPAGVNAVGDQLGKLWAAQGFDLRRRAVPGRGDMVVATRRYGGRGNVVILGHLDTVWPEGTVAEWPFSMTGDIATGPGVGDMKGGLVMALYAVMALHARGFDSLASLRLVMVPDEELGSVGSRKLIEEEAAGADVVLVIEPGRPGGGIVTSRGALGAYFVHATGCTAHCAVNYRKGASALRELALKVAPLDGLSRPDEGVVVNVGMLQGGTARQVVPGQAHMAIDMRARTQAQAEQLQAEIRRISQARQDERVSIEFSGQMTRPAFAPAHNRDLMQAAQTLADALAVKVFEVPPTLGGSDGNFTAAMGIPTLDGLGPVCHDTCSRQETIEVKSMVERAALMCGLIERIPSLLRTSSES